MLAVAAGRMLALVVYDPLLTTWLFAPNSDQRGSRPVRAKSSKELQ